MDEETPPPGLPGGGVLRSTDDGQGVETRSRYEPVVPDAKLVARMT